MKKLMFIAAATLLVACGSNNETNNENNGGGDGIEPGDYLITVERVTDGCFDNAINAVVLPDGGPRDLPAPVRIPAELPGTTDINFNDPFDDVTGIEIEASGNNGVKSAGGGFPQTGVDITTDGTGGCLADMTVSFELTESEPGTLTGTGTLTVTEATGAECPAFTTGPPCDIVTDMTAVKQ